MPDPRFWDHIEDLRRLAIIAEHEAFGFDLRGSVADQLLRAFQSDEKLWSVLVEIPPFTDLNFVVETRSEAARLRAAIAATIPASRFFEIDIRTRDEFMHRDQGNLVLKNEPTIRFGRPAKHPFTVALLWSGKDVVVKEGVPSGGGVTIEARDRISVDDVLADLVYLARRHPQSLNENVVGRLFEALEQSGALGVAEAVRREKERALLFSMAKLLLAISAKRVPDVAHWLHGTFWSGLAAVHPNPMIRRAAALLDDPPRRGVVVAGVPRKRPSAEWKTELEMIEPLPIAPGWMTLREQEIHPAAKPATFNVRFTLRPIVITTDEPEDPHCCRYRDFARGIVEVGWARPTDPAGGVSPSDIGYGFTMVKADEEEFFIASAFSSASRGEHARRIDYGLICQLSGRARPMYVMYGGVDDKTE